MAITNRLFFALWPNEGIREQISATTDTVCAHFAVDGRLLNPERYHITLRFIGDNVSAQIEAAALEAATEIDVPPFNLRLDQAGSFRNNDIPIWLGPSKIPAELSYLEEALARVFGARPRRRKTSFTPHLTILREANALLPVQPVAPIDWRIEEFVLIRSRFRPQADYEVLQRYPLSADRLPPTPQQFDLLGNT